MSVIEGGAADPYTSDPNIGVFVANNNNVAWRNTSVSDEITGSPPCYGGSQSPVVTGFTNGVLVGNSNAVPITTTIDIKVPAEELNNSFLDDGLVLVDLGQAVYDKWVQGGSVGNGFQVGTFSHTSSEGHVHTHAIKHLPNASTPYSIHVTGNSASLENIAFTANELSSVRLRFNYGVQPIEETKREFLYDIIQRDVVNGIEVSPDGVRYDIYRPDCESPDAGTDVTIGKACIASLSATPVIRDATYNWYDNFTGTYIGSGSTLDVSPMQTTTYELMVAHPNGCITYDVVTVTIDNNQTSCIQENCFSDVRVFPNPVTQSSITVVMNLPAAANITFNLTDANSIVWLNETRAMGPGYDQEVLSLQGVPLGVYYLLITCGQDQYRQEIIIRY